MELLSQEYKEFFTNIKSNSQQAVDQFVQQLVAQLQNDKIDKIF